MNLEQLFTQIQGMAAYLHNIESAVVNLDIRNRALLYHLEMLQNRLLEHNVCSKEELEAAYLEEVDKPIKEHIAELEKLQKEQIEKAQEQMKKQQEQKIVIPSEEETSSIIDASNRFKKNV